MVLLLFHTICRLVRDLRHLFYCATKLSHR
ncbi:Uncharacterised protein [Vibrio cholerae]|nr:Uncharacterised protein [Vibrio cholerae]